MVEEADAAALAVKLMLLLGCHDHAVMPPENWLRLVRLCALIRAEFGLGTAADDESATTRL